MLRCSKLFATLILTLTITTTLAAQVTFTPASCCAGNWRGPAFADINHDGFPDLITSDTTGNINVFLNDRSGHFPGPAITSSTGLRSVQFIVATDFDRDGQTDIVASEQSFDGLVVMYGNGDGTFGHTKTFHIGPTSDTAAAVIVGDFSGSGFPEIVIASVIDGIQLYPNSNGTIGNPVQVATGDWEFLATATVRNSTTTGFAAVHVRDTAADIVRDIVEFKNTAARGSAPAFTQVPVATTTAISLSAADLDNDSLSDLIYVDASNSAKVIFPNSDGTFKQLTAFTIPENDPSTGQFVQGLIALTAGDLNGDGRRDLIATALGNGQTSHDHIDYAINNGNRTFSSVQSVDMGLDKRLGVSTVARDVNNDMRADVFVPSAKDLDIMVLYPSGPSSACSLPTSAGVHICAPANGATVASPVQFSASATGVNGAVTTMKIYVDGTSQFTTSSNTLFTSLPLAIGSHRITIKGWDSTGTAVSSTINITVTNSTGACVAPSSAANNTVTICSPVSGSIVTSPVHVSAAFKTTGTVSGSKVYLDGAAVFNGGATKTIDTNIPINSGTHKITVKFWVGSTAFSNSVTVQTQ